MDKYTMHHWSALLPQYKTALCSVRQHVLLLSMNSIFHNPKTCRLGKAETLNVWMSLSLCVDRISRYTGWTDGWIDIIHVLHPITLQSKAVTGHMLQACPPVLLIFIKAVKSSIYHLMSEPFLSLPHNHNVNISPIFHHPSTYFHYS